MFDRSGIDASKVSRRAALGALVFGVPAIGGCGSGVSETVSTAEDVASPNGFYDVRRSGAVCDGLADDTAAWERAVSTVAAAGGGQIAWRGVTRVRQIKLASRVGLQGYGPEVSRIDQMPGRADGQHCVLLEENAADGVMLRDFSLNGRKEEQDLGTSASGIHFNAPNSQAAFHRIQNVRVRTVLGPGLYWGYGMRGSSIEGLSVYHCDGVGVYLRVFSDNTMHNVDVGQSGDHGFYIQNCFNSKFSNLKSWYSGRITGNGAGFYQRNGATNIFSNISSQENQGSGFFLNGADSAIANQVMHSLSSDSDNVQAGASPGMRLDNVRHCIIDLGVMSDAPLRAKPFSGLSVDSRCTGNMIRANVDPSAISDHIVTGKGIGSNNIDLYRGSNSITLTEMYTPSIYRDRETRLTLTGDGGIGNPVTPEGGAPIGMSYKLILIQDEVGGRTLEWGSHYKIPASASIDTRANTRTVIEFECFGENDWVMTQFATGIPV